jgi:hypothetical protein
MNRLIKLVVIVALVVVVWKYGIPWAKKQLTGHTSSAASADNSCTAAAQGASNAWGSELHRFANPPYDIGAWSSFRGDVEKKIASAESECSGTSQSCEAARTAMRELRNLVGDLDTAIRNGSPPPDDAVQRQEAIDSKIEAAADLARSGK